MIYFILPTTEVCDFAEDTTFHVYNIDLNNLIKRLAHDGFSAMVWNGLNGLKPITWNSAKKNVTFKFRGISVKMFGLKWGMKKLGKVQNKNYLEAK